MMAWTDSLLDTDRAIRMPISLWVRELIHCIDRAWSQGGGQDARGNAISIASNNYALMLYLLGEHALAEQACYRQIRFASRYLPDLPAAALQPHINLIRLYRGTGRCDLAQRYIDELLVKRGELPNSASTQSLFFGSELAEQIHLHENFFLKLKVAGPAVLPDYLSEIEAKFPWLGESAAFAERLVMAGMLCKDGAIVNEGLSKTTWTTYPHHKLVHAIYGGYWLATRGDQRRAVMLVQRMAGLGASSYQWRDHAMLRILERLLALAQFVGQHTAASQLNEIRAKVASRVGDVYAAVAAAYFRKDQQKRCHHLWRKVASNSGYSFMPGIPSFRPRKRTLAENRTLMRCLDAKICAVYRNYEPSHTAVASRMEEIV